VSTQPGPLPLRLSGSQPFTQQPGVYIMIGERTNVAGSPKFARLVKEGKYEEAVSIARQQVENGANVLDICMDEGMIDGVAAMTRYLQLLASEPEVAKVPFMVDSSKWEVIEAKASSTPSRLRKAKRSSAPTLPACSSMGPPWW
jgi:5-methyltetrahydrofolate--homocysteine methyltransferase